MNLKKLILVLLALNLVCFASIAATVAFLKAETGPVQNTFAAIGLFDRGTVADNFKLLETAVAQDEYGDYGPVEGMGPVTENAYSNLTPGDRLYKCPYITITNKSTVPTWLYIEVVETGDSIFAGGDTYSNHIDTDHWVNLDLESNFGIKAPRGGVVYFYKDEIFRASDQEDYDRTINIFSEGSEYFTVKEYEEDNIPGEYTLTFYAYMCQAEYEETPTECFVESFIIPELVG